MSESKLVAYLFAKDMIADQLRFKPWIPPTEMYKDFKNVKRVYILLGEAILKFRAIYESYLKIQMRGNESYLKDEQSFSVHLSSEIIKLVEESGDINFFIICCYVISICFALAEIRRFKLIDIVVEVTGRMLNEYKNCNNSKTWEFYTNRAHFYVKHPQHIWDQRISRKLCKLFLPPTSKKVQIDRIKVKKKPIKIPSRKISKMTANVPEVGVIGSSTFASTGNFKECHVSPHQNVSILDLPSGSNANSLQLDSENQTMTAANRTALNGVMNSSLYYTAPFYPIPNPYNTLLDISQASSPYSTSLLHNSFSLQFPHYPFLHSMYYMRPFDPMPQTSPLFFPSAHALISRVPSVDFSNGHPPMSSTSSSEINYPLVGGSPDPSISLPVTSSFTLLNHSSTSAFR